MPERVRARGNESLTEVSPVFSSGNAGHKANTNNSEKLLANHWAQDNEKNGAALRVSFKPLWKLLIDREMKRVDLRKATGLSAATMAKLGRDENVTTGVLVRICQALDCEIAEIVQIDGSSKSCRIEENA